MQYEKALECFQSDRIRELSLSPLGLRFLKIRSLSRKSHMQSVINRHGINVGDSLSREWAKKLYESDISTADIDDLIIELYEEGRSVRRKIEEQLIIELYRIQTFEWGGLHQNSLEKTIVDSYVKKIVSYHDLNSAIDNESRSQH